MKREVQWLGLFFIVLECVDKKFTLQLGDFPYSIGKIAFIVIGMAYFPPLNFLSRTKIVWVSFFIYLSYFAAAFFQDVPILENLSPALGTILLFIASVGFGFFVYKKNEILFLDILFITPFLYWSLYVIEKTVVGGSIISYSTIEDITNHHVSGVFISLGGLYLIFRYKYSIFSITSICIAIFTLMVLFLSESRSNLIIFSLTYLLSFIFQKGSIFSIFKSVVVVFILILGVGYNAVFSQIFQNEEVLTRFDPTNQQYIEDTNISRIELYAQFIPSFTNHPFGKGMSNPKVDTIYGEKLMHNKYATNIIKGGIFAIIPLFFLIKYLVGLFVRIRKLFAIYFINSVPKAFKSITTVLICYYLTLITVDFGGLFDHLLFSITVYLVLFADDLFNRRLNETS